MSWRKMPSATTSFNSSSTESGLIQGGDSRGVTGRRELVATWHARRVDVRQSTRAGSRIVVHDHGP